MINKLKISKSEAIAFANRNSENKGGFKISNTCFSNINESKEVWWLNIPESKCDSDFFYIILAHEDMISILNIPSRIFKIPGRFRFREDKPCFDLEICCNRSNSNFMRDVKSKGSSYDFQQHLQEELRFTR
jgi:hypothetical protein